MPIRIPEDLPARKTLEVEGVDIIADRDAIRQDIRPLRIALLNLMPEKIKTETQLARVIGASPLQVEMTLLTTASYIPSTTPREHMLAFYVPWEEVADEKFDGLIVTGAPIETLPFEAVDYWDELCAILDWAQDHVCRSFHLCWGAQAALHHFHGVPKYELDRKMFGIFQHHIVTPGSSLLRGFNDEFSMPVSRHTEVRREDIPDDPDLVILAESPESGLCLMEDLAHRAVYMFNHLEYDADTLKREYERDVAAGAEIQLPKHYFPGDDPSRTPVNRWRSYAHLLFWNWIGEIYRSTPADISQIGSASAPSLKRTGS